MVRKRTNKIKSAECVQATTPELGPQQPDATKPNPRRSARRVNSLYSSMAELRVFGMEIESQKEAGSSQSPKPVRRKAVKPPKSDMRADKLPAILSSPAIESTQRRIQWKTIEEWKKQAYDMVPSLKEKTSTLNEAIQGYNDFISKYGPKEQNITDEDDLLQNRLNIRRATSDARALAEEAMTKLIAATKAKFLKRISEAKGLDTIIEIVDEYGENQPLYLKEGRVEALVGGIPANEDKPLEAGDLMACRKPGKEGDDWILTTVLRSDDANTYIVEDVDLNKFEEHDILRVNRSDLIALPKWRANPHTHPTALYPPLACIYALLPRTTCFYEGVVVSTPASPYDPYEIAFKEEDRYGAKSYRVHQCYVISLETPKKKRNGRKG